MAAVGVAASPRNNVNLSSFCPVVMNNLEMKRESSNNSPFSQKNKNSYFYSNQNNNSGGNSK